MKKVAIADKLLRQRALRQEIKKKVLKTLIFNQELEMHSRLKCMSKLSKLNRRNFKSKVKNICIISGRSRAVNYLGLSRMKIREYQMMGAIFGLKKYS
jgi:small subunit ribosomal protein S14